VVQSTSFSGIACLAKSMKFWPLQCIGRTCSRSKFFNTAFTIRAGYLAGMADGLRSFAIIVRAVRGTVPPAP
jgi:hypothetical protein